MGKHKQCPGTRRLITALKKDTCQFRIRERVPPHFAEVRPMFSTIPERNRIKICSRCEPLDEALPAGNCSQKQAMLEQKNYQQQALPMARRKTRYTQKTDLLPTEGNPIQTV